MERNDKTKTYIQLSLIIIFIFQKQFMEVSKIILLLLIAIFLLLTLLLHYRRERTEIYEKAHVEAQYISVAMPRDFANYSYPSVKPTNPYKIRKFDEIDDEKSSSLPEE